LIVLVKIANLVVSLGEQLDGGEALDLDVLKFVGGRVHLGDDDVLGVLELLAQLIPGRNKLLAVP
jgi:hypothetical protein